MPPYPAAGKMAALVLPVPSLRSLFVFSVLGALCGAILRVAIIVGPAAAGARQVL